MDAAPWPLIGQNSEITVSMDGQAEGQAAAQRNARALW